MVHDAAPAFTHHSFTVRVVHHGHHIVAFSNFHQFIQRGKVAVHGEHAVGNHQRPAVSAGSGLDLLFKVHRVGVGETDNFSAGETRAVDDAEGGERVREDDVFLANQGGDGGAVRGEAGLKVMAASTFLKAAMRFSNCRCREMVPAMLRTAPGPTPYFCIARLPPAQGGWFASPEIALFEQKFSTFLPSTTS